MTIDFEALKARIAQTKAGLKKAGTTIKPKTGKNRYVILPPYNAAMAWHHDFGEHYVKDATDTVQAVYICANRTHGNYCVVCAAMAEVQRTVGAVNSDVAETVKKAYAAQQYLVGVLALDSDTPEIPQVLKIGKKAFEQLNGLVDEWAVQVFDPKTPQIVIIERTGTTQNDTTYTVLPGASRYTVKKPLVPIDLAEFVKMESEAAERKAMLAVKGLAGNAPRISNKPADHPALANRPHQDTDSEFEDVPDLSAAKKAATDDPTLTDDIDALLADLPA